MYGIYLFITDICDLQILKQSLQTIRPVSSSTSRVSEEVLMAVIYLYIYYCRK